MVYTSHTHVDAVNSSVSKFNTNRFYKNLQDNRAVWENPQSAPPPPPHLETHHDASYLISVQPVQSHRNAIMFCSLLELIDIHL